ncbi:Tyrosine 3-monooxygenase, partial [Toxocara canis]
VYWFIIEFGLCRQQGRYEAIGAGLLSSYGELMHSYSDAPKHRAFDPETTALQKYEDADYQPLYFVADSILEPMIKLRSFLSTTHEHTGKELSNTHLSPAGEYQTNEGGEGELCYFPHQKMKDPVCSIIASSTTSKITFSQSCFAIKFHARTPGKCCMPP